MVTVVVCPFNVADFADGGGHFWVYMQYVEGLRRAGCDVYWLESYKSSGDEASDGERLAPLIARMQRFGLSDRLLLDPNGSEDGSGGLPRTYRRRARAVAEAVFDRADLLLNFHYACRPELLARFRRTALVDIDPGLLQFWISRSQLAVHAHDLYFTTGETVGTPSARFPDCGVTWIHIRPPVALDRWPYAFEPHARAFTTVSSWDSDDWIVDGPDTYENTKRVSFDEFADLPQRTGQPLELALYLRTRQDERDRKELVRRGWRVRRSREVAATPEAYQAYIQGSRGEFSWAKRSCVRFQNAWVSDRTLCYLASGKPVVVQDTGPSAYLPDRSGMFRVAGPDEAAVALRKINDDYEGQCRAARRLAEDHFDAHDIARTILDHALP